MNKHARPLVACKARTIFTAFPTFLRPYRLQALRDYRRLPVAFLLALVTLAGQAQVKSGLDLCLRDEKTDEWLIGLFDEYAVYDCDHWEYVKAHEDWKCLLITYDDEGTEQGIPVVPVWKWLMEE